MTPNEAKSVATMAVLCFGGLFVIMLVASLGWEVTAGIIAILFTLFLLVTPQHDKEIRRE